MTTLLLPLAAVFRPPTPEEPTMNAERTRRNSARFESDAGMTANPRLCATFIEILDVGAGISLVSGNESGPV